MAATTKGIDLLWGRQTERRRGPKPTLSLPQIVATAIGIADAEGLAAVSMQRVAGEHHFTAMSLYRHVPGRAELIDLMIDTALGPASRLDSSGGWQPALAAWARQIHAVFRRHPWLIEATTRPRPTGPNELSWLEQAVGALSHTGLTGPQRVDAAAVLLANIRSQVQYEVHVASADQAAQLGAAITEALRQHAEDYPALTAAAGDGAFGPTDNDGFEFGLRCILNGIDAIITARRDRSGG